jgi:hypothetical protein
MVNGQGGITYELAFLQLGYGLPVDLNVVALEAADVELLHDAPVAGVAGRSRVDELFMLLAVNVTNIGMVLHDEMVGDGAGGIERGRVSGLGLADEGEPGDSYCCDDVLHRAECRRDMETDVDGKLWLRSMDLGIPRKGVGANVRNGRVFVLLMNVIHDY